MPVRSINLKMVVPRGRHDDGSAAALWTTHKAVNAGTRYYEELLLALRQRSYETDTKTILGGDAVAKATALIRVARARKGRPALQDPDEALLHLRALYEAMVPSAIREEGSAQAGKFSSAFARGT